MIELINQYKLELIKELEQCNLNSRIDELYSYLESKEKFSALDFSLYKDLFVKANYTQEEILKIENNIKYVTLFINNEDFLEYDEFIDALRAEFIKLKDLKKETLKEEFCKTILYKLEDLLTNLQNPTTYIEDIDFIFQIFAHFQIEFSDIKDYMKEIINHNKKVLEIHKQNNLLREEEESIPIRESKEVLESNFLTSILENISFGNLEIKILNDCYQKNKEEFEQKYNSLKNIKELNFIFSNLEDNKKIFIVLMVLSTLDIVNNVIGICKFRNIKLNKMLPNIFVSNGIKFNIKDSLVEDEFYKLFSGSYEDFINNLNYINLGIDLSKIEPTYYITDGNLTRNNHQILKKYGIDITTDSIECLTIIDLEDKLNKIIESGLYVYFKENPRKLLEIKDNAFFYRLKYAKDNKLNYKRKHLAKELFLYDGYGVTEDNYQEKVEIYKIPLFEHQKYQDLQQILIPEQELLVHPFIKMLNQNYLTEDKMTYNVNNILVSKEKVLKRFNQYIRVNKENDNKSLFVGFLYSILDGLILTEQETLYLIHIIREELVSFYPNELAELTEEEVEKTLFPSSTLKGGL